MGYTNIIPFNSLWILNQFDPDLKLQAFKGNGSGGTTTARLDIEQGNIKIGKLKIRSTTEAELRYNLDAGELKVSQIYKILSEKTGLPDINFEMLAFMERDCKLGDPNLRNILCNWERVTVNPGVYKKIVMDGKYPLQGIHELLQGFSDSLKNAPEETSSVPPPPSDKLHPEMIEEERVAISKPPIVA